MNDDELDELMGCECDCPVVPHDVYFKDGRLVVVFACTGCGKKVMVEGTIEDIYDIEITRHRRN